MPGRPNDNSPREFWRHSLLMFLALRAADAVNLTVGLYIVPRHVAPEALGGVLPLVSFATLLSLPLFALAMAVMRESSVLSARQEYGRLKSLLGGVFAAGGAFALAAFAAGGALLPRALENLRVESPAAGAFAVAGAFLGCLAPVYADALQALKKFRTLALAEISGAVLRLALLAAIMPAAPLAGYFAGSCLPPLVRIAGGTLTLGEVWRVRRAPWWTAAAVRRLARLAALLLVYLGAPMLAGMAEQWVLRTSCGDCDSAGYYLLTRLSDLLHLINLPLLLVMFPYTARSAARGESLLPFTRRAVLVSLAATALLAAVFIPWGASLLALLPHGELYAEHAPLLPWLTVATGLTAAQTLRTNAAASADRFGFLGWFVPLHLGYAAALMAGVADGAGLNGVVAVMFAVSVLRFAASIRT